ncbi:hypothetical protein BCT04_15230 [Vibrio breoganii]|uniref:hypothetical protein n=1 Tax=Vibrio breoganii TaxID=553239 RepID=UPI000C817EA3|nr:hypothetical protein [Vibrio breoganii]PMO63701.1 hypothetical protein BCT04_15230 [Vibrio breoganii]
MRLLKLLSISLVALSLSFTTVAEEVELKYFLVQGEITPEIAKLLVDNPTDPTAGAKKSIESIPGAKLIDYYLDAGYAQNIAIIAVPDSEIAAALVYQRFSTGSLNKMTVREIIPAAKVQSMLEVAKSIK